MFILWLLIYLSVFLKKVKQTLWEREVTFEATSSKAENDFKISSYLSIAL